ncbi:Sodium-dependent phosphate transport protein 1 [Aphelenchoides fujianensis]|nr:Sodium-dependent phosphate transport protein 1 [Aphelenchoides fujianensis]
MSAAKPKELSVADEKAEECTRARFLVCFVTTSFLTVLVGNSLALNFTVICMHEGGVPLFSERQISWLFSAVAAGTLGGSLPFAQLQRRAGMRWALVLHGALSAAATFGLPPATRAGFWAVVACRFLHGWALACVYPAIGGVTNEWATWEQSGTSTALLSTSLQLGAVLTMPLAGVVCESRWGWPLLNVLQGAATLLATAAFFSVFRDSPAAHPLVNAREAALLRRHKADGRAGRRVPVRAIAADPAAWGIFAGFFGASFAFQLFNQYTPVYLSRMLELRVESAGWAAALPPLAGLVVKLLVGPLSDRLPLLSARCRLVLFASAAALAQAVCFVTLAALPASRPLWAQAAFTAAVGCSGLNAVGVMKATQLVAGPFAAVLIAVNQLLASFGLLVLPPIVAAVAPHNTRQEWAFLLVGTALFVLATTAFFDLTATATPRPWATGNDKKRTVFQISSRMEGLTR